MRRSRVSSVFWVLVQRWEACCNFLDVTLQLNSVAVACGPRPWMKRNVLQVKNGVKYAGRSTNQACWGLRCLKMELMSVLRHFDPEHFPGIAWNSQHFHKNVKMRTWTFHIYWHQSRFSEHCLLLGVAMVWRKWRHARLWLGARCDIFWPTSCKRVAYFNGSVHFAKFLMPSEMQG